MTPIEEETPTVEGSDPAPAGGPVVGTEPADPDSPTGPGDPAAPRPRRSSRWRRALVVVLLVLSSLSVLISSVSIWAHRTIFNTDQWVATVGPLATNEAVITSVSDHVTEQLGNVIKPEQVAKNALPPVLGGLAGPIGEGFDQIVHTAVTRILHSDQFQSFWIAANRAVHSRVIAVLEGKPTPHLQTANGDIQLNLLPVMSKVLIRVQSRAPGLLKTNGPIPVITPDTPVDQARSELSQALGRTLPADFGTPTLFHSEQLASAQHIVSAFNKLIVALVVVTAALMVGTVIVAERRRRAIIALAVGIVVAMTLAYALTKVITNQVVSSITQPDDRGAVRATFTTLLKGLNVISAILIGVGLVAAVVAFVMGPSRIAGSIRHHSSDIGRSLVGKNSDGEVPPVLAWMAKYRMPLWLAGLVAALLVLILVVEGWVGLLVTVLVLAAYEGTVTWASHRAGAELAVAVKD